MEVALLVQGLLVLGVQVRELKMFRKNLPTLKKVPHWNGPVYVGKQEHFCRVFASNYRSGSSYYRQDESLETMEIRADNPRSRATNSFKSPCAPDPPAFLPAFITFVRREVRNGPKWSQRSCRNVS